MGKSRKRIYSHVFTMVLQSEEGGAIIHHTGLNPGPVQFQSDGVHLSSLENYIFLNSLVEAIVVYGHSTIPN